MEPEKEITIANSMRKIYFMDEINKISVMESKDVINIIRNTLKLVDERLMDHGGRVAYILYNMLKHSNKYNEQEKNNICILGIFHDIGAYKTDEIDKLLKFETNNILDHSIYGYLFLKYLTPFGKMSEAILYHHMEYVKFNQINSDYKDIALLINLADRIDILLQNHRDNFKTSEITIHSALKFDPLHIEMFEKCYKETNLKAELLNGEYENKLQNFLTNIQFTNEEINSYLIMLIFSIDFRSVNTVTHTIDTICVSMEIARLLNYNKKELAYIYYGSMLHDIGKIAIPMNIVEYPGKLNNNAMTIMKTHIDITREIIEGIIDQDICDIAVRHHEKLDGTGYPDGLKGENLTESQRIVAVADIVSALNGKRSYKEPFSPEKTISIIKQMRDGGKLCPKICNLVICNYDEIINRVRMVSNQITPIYLNIAQEYKHLNSNFPVK
ncbi:HD-GYP domain-containing protein [Anaerovorax odorimutans]|uniref:HD-GYP domain-containing protein n=1 Tax=Anaerovorax odorimutans TaxID=109327 RepID=UPI0004066CFF|nr:HD domain-containing phosphohydrolase [Anaerovorax odorimutans]